MQHSTSPPFYHAITLINQDARAQIRLTLDAPHGFCTELWKYEGKFFNFLVSSPVPGTIS